MLEESNNNSKFSADLVSSTCQFCGESFNRPTDLSLHYKEKRSRKWTKRHNYSYRLNLLRSRKAKNSLPV